MTVNVAPCPFCGGEAKMLRSSTTTTVFCPHLNCYVGPSVKAYSDSEAIGMWNRRTLPAIPADVRYVINKALERYKNRIQEVAMMGWYSSATVTTDEIIRIDAALSWLGLVERSEG